MNRVLWALSLAFLLDAPYLPPRTADGRPDLQGVWSFASGVPLQRPSAFAGKKFFTREEFAARRAYTGKALRTLATLAPVEAIGLDWVDTSLYVDDLRTSLITYPENGRLPATVDGVRRMITADDLIATLNDPNDGPPGGFFSLLAAFGDGRRDSHLDFTMSERCLLGPGVPLLPNMGESYLQIIQARDHIVLVTDEFRRVIAIGEKAGKTPPRAALQSWGGTSTGRWDGDTLIVYTENFNGRTPSLAGAGDSRAKVVTERFTRTSKQGLAYSAVVVDPETFRDRVEVSVPMGAVDKHIFESACHEGNYSLRNTLSASRRAE